MNFGMEIFCETLCKFMERKVRSTSEGERIVLQGSTMKSMDLYKSIQAKLYKPETILPKIYKHVVCKKAFLSLAVVYFLLGCISSVFDGNWVYLNIAICLMYGIFHSYLIILNPFNNWVYIWRLELYLWFREIPQHSNHMAHPRCITMHWDTLQVPKKMEQQRMILELIENLKNELGIYEFYELKSTLQAIQASSHSKQSAIFKLLIKRCWYHFLFLSVFGILCYKFPHRPPGVVIVLIYLVVVCLLEHAFVIFINKKSHSQGIWPELFICFTGIYLVFCLYCRMDFFSWLVISFIVVVFFMLICFSSHRMSFFLNKFKFSEEEISRYFETIDVIFRVHGALKNESICFTVVTDDFNVLTQIPDEYQRYFKFIIVAKNNLVSPEIYDHSFDLSEISKIIHPPVPILPTAEINLTNCVEASLRCVNKNASQFVANGLKFLSLLIEINSSVLSNDVILSVVRPQLTKLASNFKGEMSLQNQDDFDCVNEFIRYFEKIGIIHNSRKESVVLTSKKTTY